MIGSILVNYVKMTESNKEINGNNMLYVWDTLYQPRQFIVKEKVIMNYESVHFDVLCLLDQPDFDKRISSFRGTHFIFRREFLGENQGMVVPEITDNCILFIINYVR
jgi:glycerol-3-phosphate dehydrogenase